MADSILGGDADGIGVAASFNHPFGITNDGTNLYVADVENHTIRKIVIASAAVSAFAGIGTGGSASTDGTGTEARFHYPLGITNDGTNLYVADSWNHTIRKIVIATGEVTTLTGASLFPVDITIDGTNLYETEDWNHEIRKIVISTGEVTTLVEAADGYLNPYGITSDGTNLYVTDNYYNYSLNSYFGLIRKITIASGKVTTLEVFDGDHDSEDGTGSAAKFKFLKGITNDGTNLYVAESGNYTIRKIVIATGEVTTFAGTAGISGSMDGTGALARFKSLVGITNDGTNLYVTDAGNNTIRKIVIATAEVVTLAGMVGSVGSGDGTGATASFSAPTGITSDGTSLYVADMGNHAIRKISF
jgi:hypothetical protein